MINQDPEVKTCNYIVREDGSISCYVPQGNAVLVLADTYDTEKAVERAEKAEANLADCRESLANKTALAIQWESAANAWQERAQKAEAELRGMQMDRQVIYDQWTEMMNSRDAAFQRASNLDIKLTTIRQILDAKVQHGGELEQPIAERPFKVMQPQKESDESLGEVMEYAFSTLQRCLDSFPRKGRTIVHPNGTILYRANWGKGTWEPVVPS